MTFKICNMELNVTKKTEFTIKPADLDEILKLYFKEHHNVEINAIATRIKHDGDGGYAINYIECTQVTKSTIKK